MKVLIVLIWLNLAALAYFLYIGSATLIAISAVGTAIALAGIFKGYRD